MFHVQCAISIQQQPDLAWAAVSEIRSQGEQGGLHFRANAGKSEVAGRVFQAIQVQLDERVAFVPEHGFYQREFLREETGKPAEKGRLQLALAELICNV